MNDIASAGALSGGVKTTDVNTQFAAEQRRNVQNARDAAQRNSARDALRQADYEKRVAEGTMRNLGGGRYQSVGGWDDGEVWQLTTNSEGTALLLPQSGLEEVNGKASLAVARPAWHDLGFDNGGEPITDIGMAIENGGLDFMISQRPVFFYDDHGELHEMPGKFVNARTDTWAGMGVVGDIYKSVQPRESFGWLQSLVGHGDLLIQSAGVLRGGAKTFITVSLPDTVSIDPQGVDIKAIPYLALLDDHAGERKLWAITTPWIVVCGNTHNFALRDAVTRWGIRHSTNIHDRLDVARETLGLTLKGYEAFTREEELLLHTGMTTGQFEEFLATLYPRTDEDSSKNARTREANRDDDVHQAWALETGRLGFNRFAAEMTLTGLWDNVWRNASDGKSQVARATALLEGEDKRKKAVHKQLLEVR